MTNLPPSNLPFLKRAFSDIIQSERDIDQTSKTSSPICQRKSFGFTDGSYLSITEFIKNNKIDWYHYDWFSKKKRSYLNSIVKNIRMSYIRLIQSLSTFMHKDL